MLFFLISHLFLFLEWTYLSISLLANSISPFCSSKYCNSLNVLQSHLVWHLCLHIGLNFFTFTLLFFMFPCFVCNIFICQAFKSQVSSVTVKLCCEALFINILIISKQCSGRQVFILFLTSVSASVFSITSQGWRVWLKCKVEDAVKNFATFPTLRECSPL